MISDVVSVAWKATGSPTTIDPPTGSQPEVGTCARCGEADELTPIRKVLSRNFTAFDGWSCLTSGGLCRACSWAYRHPMLRSVPHLVVRWPELIQPLTPEGLSATLSRSLSTNLAVVVPLRASRKHAVSAAAWGHVVADDVLLTWTAADAARLTVVHSLHALGISHKALPDPVPPYKVLRGLPGEALAQVLTWWDQLTPWRSQPMRFQLAAKTSPHQHLPTLKTDPVIGSAEVETP